MIGVLAIPFVTPSMTVAQQTIDKQTKIEQDTLKKFYKEPEYVTGSFMVSGTYSFTGQAIPVSGIMSDKFINF